MEAPFSLDILLKRYGSRRHRLEPIYKRMFEEAQHLAAPHTLQQTFMAAELPAFADSLPGAETITLGLCTVGSALENRVTELFNEDPVSAVVLDEIGTYWIHKLGEEMHRNIRDIARAAGKQSSPSYRPGIGRWPLALQIELLNHLSAAEIGVQLSNDMMEPQKSISMIIAVGDKLHRTRYAPEKVT